jgi:hypothetical protein
MQLQAKTRLATVGFLNVTHAAEITKQKIIQESLGSC